MYSCSFFAIVVLLVHTIKKIRGRTKHRQRSFGIASRRNRRTRTTTRAGLDEDQGVDAARTEVNAGRGHGAAAAAVVNRAMDAARRRSGSSIDNTTALVCTL